jgi:hypothetical protein
MTIGVISPGNGNICQFKDYFYGGNGFFADSPEKRKKEK